MKVPYVDIAAENGALADEFADVLTRVVNHGWLIGGDEVATFEGALAAYLGARHIIALNSGTDALVLALKLRGIGPGDEVILPSHSFLATANAVAWLGATPVFADIDDETMCLCPERTGDAVTSATRAIIVVDLNGYPVDLQPFRDLAKARGLHVIEDAAQSLGAHRDGKMSGTSGLGCFSLHPLKVLGALGDAGFMSVTDAGDADALRRLRNHGLLDRDHAAEVGCNSRLDALQAGLLSVKLRHLEGWIETRRATMSAYRAALGESVRLPPIPEGGAANGGVFVVRHRQRDELLAGLRERGVDAKIHYPIPIHRQASFAGARVELPVTDRVVDEILSLPVHPGLSAEQRDYVIDCVREAAKPLGPPQ